MAAGLMCAPPVVGERSIVMSVSSDVEKGTGGYSVCIYIG